MVSFAIFTKSFTVKCRLPVPTRHSLTSLIHAISGKSRMSRVRYQKQIGVETMRKITYVTQRLTPDAT